MRLEVKDQIHVSSIQADSLRPGDKVRVTAAQGAELLKAHPDKFVDLAEPEEDSQPAEKAAPTPVNKMEAAPANKAAPKSSSK